MVVNNIRTMDLSRKGYPQKCWRLRMTIYEKEVNIPNKVNFFYTQRCSKIRNRNTDIFSHKGFMLSF